MSTLMRLYVRAVERFFVWLAPEVDWDYLAEDD